MALRRGKKWKVVATVVDGGTGDDQCEPEPGDSNMGSCNDWSCHYWGKVHKVVLKGVAIDGGYSNRSCPLVVCLVDVFVEKRVVEESGGKEGGGERGWEGEMGGERGWEGKLGGERGWEGELKGERGWEGELGEGRGWERERGEVGEN